MKIPYFGSEATTFDELATFVDVISFIDATLLLKQPCLFCQPNLLSVTSFGEKLSFFSFFGQTASKT